jgi:hypothetical protein
LRSCAFYIDISLTSTTEQNGEFIAAAHRPGRDRSGILVVGEHALHVIEPIDAPIMALGRVAEEMLALEPNRCWNRLVMARLPEPRLAEKRRRPAFADYFVV